MPESVHSYDIAVSFSGKQRTLVEPVVRACQARGLKVFYDRDSASELWGRDLITSLRSIYGGASTRYFVPFLSADYLTSAYPMDEFKTAIRRALEISADDYILPVVVGPVEVPPELLSPSIAYLRLEDYSTDELAKIIADRVGVAQQDPQEPRGVVGITDEAPRIRLPRLTPSDFVPFEALTNALARVGALFQSSADELTRFGIRCIVQVSDAMVDVRLYRQGQHLCGLRLRFSDSFRDDRLQMAFEWPRITGDQFSGWVTAQWDTDRNRPILEFTDFGMLSGGPSLVTADELFQLLWEKIMHHIESVH